MSSLILKRLRAHNWRNLSEVHVDFSTSCNQIVGNNAQGKTNLLEALYFFISGRSFRTHLLTDLMGPSDSGFYLELEFSKHGVEQQLRIACRGKGQGAERKIFYNHTPCHSFIELLGIIPGVLLAPEDSDIVKGMPACRRDFLDLVIAQSDPLYVHYQSRYAKAMRHRNHLLRLQKIYSIESWEQEMASSAAYIVPKRLETIHDLEKRSSIFQQALSGKEDHLRLFYKDSLPEGKEPLVERYLRAFATQRPREMLLGHTLLGPHKDDLAITVNERDARQFASEGQQRTIVTALRIAHWQRLFDTLGEKPVMLIDDLGMGLDNDRKESLMHCLQNLGQIFVSIPQPTPFYAEKSRCIHMEKGKATKVFSS